jgi:hypothetical protein
VVRFSDLDEIHDPFGDRVDLASEQIQVDSITLKDSLWNPREDVAKDERCTDKVRAAYALGASRSVFRGYLGI